MKRPRDLLHRIYMGHWPDWAPMLLLFPDRWGTHCRECGQYHLKHDQ